MEKRRLGHTDVEVSVICLGSMTWGQQNTEAEGFTQMDYAVDHGVNFIDTAELYSVPPSEATYGMSEKVIGKWIKDKNNRDDIVVASKIAADTPNSPWIRGGESRFDKVNIDQAIEGSLKRLQTNYIDLYQLHWPERRVNSFGRLNFPDDAEIRKNEVRLMHEALIALKEHVVKGNIRYIGLSNETPWGVMQFLRLAEKYDLPKVVSIQNPYSFLNRTYEIGLSEVSLQEGCGLLAYSPIAGGTLSGKYLGGKMPSGARRSIDARKSRYSGEKEEKVVSTYIDIARKHGLDPVQMALSFVNSRRFLTSNIIGATNMDQLANNIASVDLELSKDVLEDINAAHLSQPNPFP